MADPKPTVGVVGASARAAVHSLARAGYSAWAVDLFADRDLARVAPTAHCPLDDYPHAIPALAEQFPPGPVLYTGGLENHPDVVAALAARRPLWGNPPAVLEVVRDPFFPSRVWPHTDSPVRCPRVLPGDASPADGAWLLKPRRGSGGYGIRPFHPADPPAAPNEFYLQELVSGQPMSAVFIAAGGDARLLGMTEHLVGVGWLHENFFRYAGNIGPVALPESTELALAEFGRVVARAAPLVGLFGVDFQYAGGIAHPVEINPRYPASVEVIEYATGQAMLLDHAACFDRPPEPRLSTRPGAHRVVGKAVYYAPWVFQFPPGGPWDDWNQPFNPWDVPAFADVPDPGAAAESGWPVLTMFETGSTPAGVRRRLQSRAMELDREFDTSEDDS